MVSSQTRRWRECETRAGEVTTGSPPCCSTQRHGRTVYEVAQTELPRLPGVLVVPTVGGQDEPEARYQTNEITQQVAAKVGGSPVFL